MPEIRVGTSGWQYRHWRKAFYPERLPVSQWLAHYARTFDCVEVNASFYRLPSTESIARWREAVPANFRFAVKAPRRITHFKKLKNCDAELEAFVAAARTFESKLGPLLFELPPRWRCNLRRLQGFLDALPRGHRYVFEFRDASWHDAEVYALLESSGAAFCIFDVQGETSPLADAGELVYVRLHGPAATAYTGSYRAPRLRSWSAKALGWSRKGKDVFVFFDNDERAFAVKNARRLAGFLEEERRGRGNGGRDA